jgi:hypothetical protein
MYSLLKSIKIWAVHVKWFYFYGDCHKQHHSVDSFTFYGIADFTNLSITSCLRMFFGLIKLFSLFKLKYHFAHKGLFVFNFSHILLKNPPLFFFITPANSQH